MKHNLLLFFVALLTTATAAAYDFEVDGLYYYINSDGNSVSVIHDDDITQKYNGNIVIPESITVGETTYTVTSIGDSAFSDCAGLTSVTIPNSITHIDNYAFWNCTGLSEINLGNSITSIGNSAFSGCSKLTSLTIPNFVSTIGVHILSPAAPG